jgi:hypothetical protein
MSTVYVWGEGVGAAAVRTHLEAAGGTLVCDAVLADTAVIVLPAELDAERAPREVAALALLMGTWRGRSRPARIVVFDLVHHGDPVRGSVLASLLRYATSGSAGRVLTANAVAATCPAALPAALDVVLAVAGGLLDAVRGQILTVDPPKRTATRRPSLAGAARA